MERDSDRRENSDGRREDKGGRDDDAVNKIMDKVAQQDQVSPWMSGFTMVFIVAVMPRKPLFKLEGKDEGECQDEQGSKKRKRASLGKLDRFRQKMEHCISKHRPCGQGHQDEDAIL